ncbi:ABC transporter ATP-binding protein [uncultured Flavonifractor sp.]|uniref:ABC transporter ATP-binding protein n=1 Tax=uncultured Flavonifractor sp. TaxID=1193534 RepID=UPI00261AC5F1|nr:ABC transporter ATP-binding protein [uncultured Flavonifractor sp.]
MNQTQKKDSGVLSRVLRYMLRFYGPLFALVVVCILLSAVATVVAATFPQTLVDDYIIPMLSSGSRDFSGLAADLTRLACLLAVGIVAAFGYNRIMVNISQGTMRRLRNDLFRNMEALPIQYFDTHAHGDIMSVYTNDVDTLRQLLSQSIPQLINSVVTMAATLVTMLVINPALTVISLLTALVMLLVTRRFSRLAGQYYIRQQQDLGVVDGFIEEMLDGQKVVKVFCHEQAAKADFARVNEALRQSADKANRYANLLMPINNNIGWLSYVLVAIVGAVLGINGLAGVTLGTVVTFVGLNKSFTQPITQVSQQVNFVVNAAARLANADGFIRRLPNGYDTMLTGDGANLSQGQRQLIAIARAAVADPPALILDEATSSIDTRTEKLVQDGMDALMTGRTTFVIAHRLSTVRNADCIMVMEQGRIIEQGTHDQLMEQKGKYYQLYTGKPAQAAG